MEKLLVILLSAALTVSETSQSDFPLSASERWQFLFIVIAAVLTSLSTESSKQTDEEKFRPMRFFGSVGLGVAAGVAAPLFIAWLAEALLKVHTDWRASIGLSIMGAYFGRDMLQWLFSLVKALKRLKIGLSPEEDDQGDSPNPPAPPTPSPESAGGDQDVQ